MEVARGKYPPLATGTDVINCFSIHWNSEVTEHKNVGNF